MKLFLLGKMCITFHLYRNSDILLYLFKNKQGALKLKKKKPRTTKYSSQMWYISFVFISWSWHLKWSEWRTCWTHWQPEWWCFCSHPVQTSSAGPKNLWPDFIVISLFFSVFINCTVLFKFFFASTVMIKWWLSSSVTFPCHCYCLSWRILISGLWNASQTISLQSSWWKNNDTRSSELFNFYLRPQRVGERLWGGLWGDFILGFWFYCFLFCLSLFFNIAGKRGGGKAETKTSDIWPWDSPERMTSNTFVSIVLKTIGST